MKKLKTSYLPLRHAAKCWYGIITGSDPLLLFDKNEIDKLGIEPELILPIIRAQDCSKYSYVQPSKYTIYPYKEVGTETVLIDEKLLKEKYPKTYNYLKNNKSKLANRKDSRKKMGDTKGWYSLVRFGKYQTFHKPKIVTPGEVKENKFGFDETGAGYSGARVFGITAENENINIKVLLAILNSKLVELYLHSVAPLKQGGYYSYSSTNLDSVPLPHNIFKQEHETKEIKELNKYVDLLLENNRKLDSSKTDMEKSALKRKNKFIEIEMQILIYKLYELNEEEISIIEGS